MNSATALQEENNMPNATRTHADTLTIAYVAIGADDAIHAMQDRGTNCDFEKWGGELGFIEEVTNHALMLDRLADGQELAGCFVYEVAQPFGFKMASAIYEGSKVSAEDVGRQLVAEITAEAA